jgi:hypothetical protein
MLWQCALYRVVVLQAKALVRWIHVEQWPTPLDSAAPTVHGSWDTTAHVAKG